VADNRKKKKGRDFMADPQQSGWATLSILVVAAGLVLGATIAPVRDYLPGAQAQEKQPLAHEKGGKGSAYTLWISALGILAPTGSSLSLEKGRSGDTVTITCGKVGDLQWVLLPLTVPSNVKIKKVIVCYRVSNERSYLKQVRLSEERIPPTATVMHDDGTDLKSTTGACYESRVNSLQVGGALTLALRLNFTNLADSISVGAIGLVVEP
jgi:hypothetical protein